MHIVECWASFNPCAQVNFVLLYCVNYELKDTLKTKYLCAIAAILTEEKTLVANIMHSKECSGNQGKRQNFDPSILPHKFGLIFIGLKQKKFFFLEKKVQNGRLKKTEIFKIANSQNFFRKILQIGPWVSRID